MRGSTAISYVGLACSTLHQGGGSSLKIHEHSVRGNTVRSDHGERFWFNFYFFVVFLVDFFGCCYCYFFVYAYVYAGTLIFGGGIGGGGGCCFRIEPLGVILGVRGVVC